MSTASNKDPKWHEVLATAVFIGALLMMFAPLIAFSLGFAGVYITPTYVKVGVAGLVLFFVAPMIGLYGKEQA